MTIVLNNVRSAWNVGSIFRTADAIGADVVLIGYTPLPTGKTEKLVAKTAIGAEKTVAWKHYEHEQEALQALKDNMNIGIEISSRSKNVYEFIAENRSKMHTILDACFWFGNEIHGLSPELCAQLDAEINLPMKGMKESLNVANTVCAVGYILLGFMPTIPIVSSLK